MTDTTNKKLDNEQRLKMHILKAYEQLILFHCPEEKREDSPFYASITPYGDDREGYFILRLYPSYAYTNTRMPALKETFSQEVDEILTSFIVKMKNFYQKLKNSDEDTDDARISYNNSFSCYEIESTLDIMCFLLQEYTQEHKIYSEDDHESHIHSKESSEDLIQRLSTEFNLSADDLSKIALYHMPISTPYFNTDRAMTDGLLLHGQSSKKYIHVSFKQLRNLCDLAKAKPWPPSFEEYNPH